ncbi:hypothetical protein Tsubulata_025496 [Turnera subulata]|uniref:Uncharacterized protein n=1 Tax=Turnera subulata TaxID=218843 RepID=A0A9Q0FJB0_9ROSI|nr:hypothetical protein Tsubulata_025496 [Turnera subulata]
MRSIFHRVYFSTSFFTSWAQRYCNHPSAKKQPFLPPSNNDAHPIILYFTTLYIVHRTYEDCRTVRSILRDLCIPSTSVTSLWTETTQTNSRGSSTRRWSPSPWSSWAGTTSAEPPPTRLVEG